MPTHRTEFRIEAMIYGGSGTGRAANGSIIAVPFTLPGEIIEAASIADQAANPEWINILAPSADRVAPLCPHFGACGGCQYQHASYPAQTQIKLGILSDTLQAAGLSNLPKPHLHTGVPWAYRNRIRLRIAILDGTLRFGYNRRGSYDMLPIQECAIAAPLLLRGATAVLAAAAAMPAWARHLTECELFTDSDQLSLQITFFLRTERSTNLKSLCEQIKINLPELTGAGVIVVGESGRKQQPGAQWGAPGVRYHAAGHDYWVSRGSFFQVNRFLIDDLVRLVTQGRRGTLAWDLYAGVGLFSRALAETFAEVIGVETDVRDLSAVLKTGAIGATVADFLRAAVLQRERPDLIVMDPPRAGLGPEVCDLLGRVYAPAMVYVSCDPTTLARDLSAVVNSGYTIHQIHLVDLFPQTFHMETVVVLNR